MVAQPAPTLAQIEGFEITTDELFEDKRESRIIARGNVEIRYFGEILQADEVIYDRKINRFWAQGKIQLQESDGKITRTDAISLNDGLRDAFLRYARREKVLRDR
jgi:lipopolysaccharide assembly outer membrane protein LptD (OstA)